MQTYPQEYIDYLIYFHTERDLFECHEVLEEYWKKMPECRFGTSWVGLIQVAVGLYHQRRGNLKGAAKMLASASNQLSETALNELGLDGENFLQSIQARSNQIQENPTLPYEDFNLPIKDLNLLRICLQTAEQKKLQWLKPSDLSNLQLLHKHTLRDRSEVIQERENQYKLRVLMRKAEGEGHGQNISRR